MGNCENKRVYFGVILPENLPLDTENQRNLIIQLLLNQRIPVNRVQSIINNGKYWRVVSELDTKFNLSIGKVSSFDPQDKQEGKKRVRKSEVARYKWFKQRLHSWIVEFSVPTHQELKTLAQELDIDYSVLIDDLFSIVNEYSLPKQKFIETFKVLSIEINNEQINKLLDQFRGINEN